MSVTTEDLLGCLWRNQSILTLHAEEVWLNLIYTGKASNSLYIRAPPACNIQVRGQGNGAMSMLIFNATCSTANRLVVHSPMWNRHSFDCDPTAWVAPGVEMTMTSYLANVSIEINNASMPYSLHALFKVFESRGKDMMEVRHVTDYLGTWVLVLTVLFKSVL